MAEGAGVMSYDRDTEERGQSPLWFHAGEDIQSCGEALCRECGLPIIPGELIAEVEDEWGMLFVHEACCGEDL